MREQEYLEAVTTQIRSKVARQYVEEELRNHMEDQAEENKKNGMTDSEAMEEAVKEMGDPLEVGVEMDRLHKPKMNWGFIIFIAMLSILSMAIQCISGIQIAHIIYTMIGLGIMIGVCYLDYSILGRHATIIAVVFLIAMAMAFVFFPLEINGAVRWAGTEQFSISLWSMLHLYPALYGALLYSQRGSKFALLKALIMLIVPVLYAYYMPAISLTVGMFFALLLMLSIAIVKGWVVEHKKTWLLTLWGSAIILPVSALAFLLTVSPANSYQVARIKSYFHVDSFVELQANPVGQYLDIQSSTNYLIRFLMNYYGVFAGIILIVIITLMIFQVFRISIKQKNQLGMMVGIGCGLVFATQTFAYVLLNLGVLRSTDVYLPLFTYGANGTFVSYVLLGLVLSIFRYQNVVPQTVKRAR